MPNSQRNADADFLQGPRIPGALRFNLDKVAEHDKAKNPLGLTHMLPSAETFRDAVGEWSPRTSFKRGVLSLPLWLPRSTGDFLGGSVAQVRLPFAAVPGRNLLPSCREEEYRLAAMLLAGL